MVRARPKQVRSDFRARAAEIRTVPRDGPGRALTTDARGTHFESTSIEDARRCCAQQREACNDPWERGGGQQRWSVIHREISRHGTLSSLLQLRMWRGSRSLTVSAYCRGGELFFRRSELHVATGTETEKTPLDFPRPESCPRRAIHGALRLADDPGKEVMQWPGMFARSEVSSLLSCSC